MNASCRVAGLLVGVAAIAMAGCSTTRMSGDQLARVAKDWALAFVRAR